MVETDFRSSAAVVDLGYTRQFFQSSANFGLDTWVVEINVGNLMISYCKGLEMRRNRVVPDLIRL